MVVRCGYGCLSTASRRCCRHTHVSGHGTRKAPTFAHGPTRQMYEDECEQEAWAAELRAKEEIVARVERRQAAKDRTVRTGLASHI